MKTTLRFFIGLVFCVNSYAGELTSLNQLLQLYPVRRGEDVWLVLSGYNSNDWGGARIAKHYTNNTGFATNLGNVFQVRGATNGQWVFSDRTNLVQNAAWWGVVNDRTVDSSTNLQAALDWFPTAGTNTSWQVYTRAARGGTLAIPEGIFMVSRPIRLSSGVEIAGSGRGASVILNTGTTNDVLSFIPSTPGAMNPVFIHDLTITQDSTIAHTNGAAIFVSYQSGGGATALTIKNVSTAKTYLGLNIDNVYASTVENCEFNSHVDDGVRTGWLVTSTTLKGTYAKSNGGDGYETKGHYVSFISTASDLNGGYGYNVPVHGVGLEGSQSMVFSAAGAELNSAGGYLLRGVLSATLESPFVSQATNSGPAIVIDGGQDVIIKNPNLFCSSGSSPPSPYPMIALTNTVVGAYPAHVSIDGIDAAQDHQFATWCSNPERVYALGNSLYQIGSDRKNLRIGPVATAPNVNDFSLLVNADIATASGGSAYPVYVAPRAVTNLALVYAVYTQPKVDAAGQTIPLLIDAVLGGPTLTAGTITRGGRLALRESTNASTMNFALGIGALAAGDGANWSIFNNSTNQSFQYPPIRWYSSTGPIDTYGSGSPESVLSAVKGSVYRDRVNGGIYVKDSGTGTTGWLKALAGSIQSTNITDSTAAGRTLLTAATAADQRTALGLGTLATIDDAPSDGNRYVRSNATWAVSSGGGTGTNLDNLTVTNTVRFGSDFYVTGGIGGTNKFQVTAAEVTSHTPVWLYHDFVVASGHDVYSLSTNFFNLGIKQQYPGYSDYAWLSSIGFKNAAPLRGANILDSTTIDWTTTSSTNITPSIKSQSLSTNLIDSTFYGLLMTSSSTTSTTNYLDRTLFYSRGQVIVGTTNAYQSLVTDVPAYMSQTIPAGDITTNFALRVTAGGTLTSTNDNWSNNKVHVRVGGLLITHTITDDTSGVSLTDSPWTLNTELTVTQTGTNATVYVASVFRFTYDDTVGEYPWTWTFPGVVSGSLDTTGSAEVDVEYSQDTGGQEINIKCNSVVATTHGAEVVTGPGSSSSVTRVIAYGQVTTVSNTAASTIIISNALPANVLTEDGQILTVDAQGPWLNNTGGTTGGTLNHSLIGVGLGTASYSAGTSSNIRQWRAVVNIRRSSSTTFDTTTDFYVSGGTSPGSTYYGGSGNALSGQFGSINQTIDWTASTNTFVLTWQPSSASTNLYISPINWSITR